MRLLSRCSWTGENDLRMIRYHDHEWGILVHNDRKIFEFLVLEAFQAGLSWRTILYKRDNFRKNFAGFDFKKVACFGPKEVRRLMKDKGIIRNRAKILATINNAQRFLEVRREFGTFSRYMWSWVGGKSRIHRFKSLREFPTQIPEAVLWAKDLKKRGFGFLGPTVVYAHMQAVGMVNDHIVSCFRYRPITNANKNNGA